MQACHAGAQLPSDTNFPQILSYDSQKAPFVLLWQHSPFSLGTCSEMLHRLLPAPRPQSEFPVPDGRRLRKQVAHTCHWSSALLACPKISPPRQRLLSRRTCGRFPLDACLEWHRSGKCSPFLSVRGGTQCLPPAS